jgi:hypothetical protein
MQRKLSGHGRLAIVALAGVTVCVGLCIGWTALGREMVRRDAEQFPWVGEPINAESKASLCASLALEATHPLCRPDSTVYAPDVLPTLEKKFPLYTTPYTEVAQILAGYPVSAEESNALDGTVTSRRYVYLLTNFDDFCVAFDVDLRSGMIDRIYGSQIGSGSTPGPCGPKRKP